MPFTVKPPRSIKDIEETIQSYLYGSYMDYLPYVVEKERTKQINDFIRNTLQENWHNFYAWYLNFHSDNYENFILEMLNYINIRVDNIGETIKIFTAENIFNQFALIVGNEYKDELFRFGGEIIFGIYIDDCDDEYDIRNTFEEAMNLLEELKESNTKLSIKHCFCMKNVIPPIIDYVWDEQETHSIKCKEYIDKNV